MAKLTLKLGQILQLESEINGFVNPQTGKEVYLGFRKHKLPLKTKYWLTELGDRLASERKTIETLRDEIIQKHGEDDGKGGIQIGVFIEQKDENDKVISRELNPKYVEFQTEFNALLSEDKEIEYSPLTMEDLDRVGETSDDYNLLFMLVQKPTESEE
jgi:hypothetical protein